LWYWYKADSRCGLRWGVLVRVLDAAKVAMDVVSEGSPSGVFMVTVNQNRAAIPEGSPS
jgi:hypothetical protein